MIYFDNASTTALSEPVLELVYNALKNDFANPSSLHGAGFRAERLISAAREQLAGALRVSSEDIYFTSGGTEANNTAIIGAARANARRGRHLITSVIEHPSVTDAFRSLEKDGFEVTCLPVDEKGYVSAEALKSAVRQDTVLVSIMYVNNETGTIQDIKTLSGAAKEINKGCIFHTDCVQAFGKHIIPSGCVDMISVSGHKIHAPKGVGALYVKRGTHVDKLHFGGGQERGFRPGTENTASIIGFGLAAEIADREMSVNYENVSRVREALLKGISLENVFVNGDSEKASPYILNLSFEGVKGEVLLHALEDDEIYVATGSACSARLKKKKKIVDLLVDGRGENNVRFSFCGSNTVSEAEMAAERINAAVPVLRRFRPR